MTSEPTTEKTLRGELKRTIDEAWQDLVEKDDRTSPEEYPDMALITHDELAGYMAHAALLSPSSGEEERIGPRARPHLFVCKGCPAYETENWHEPSGDGETYDTGQYAWCNAAGRRSMGAYHYDHTPRPEWCPALSPTQEQET